MSKTFCPLPWNFQAIRSNGDLRVCCQSNIAPGRGILKKKSGENYNASIDNLDDSRNSETVKEVRRKMLAGEWSSNCLRCQQEEESGLTSRRGYEGERWSLSFEDVKKHTQADGSIDLQKLPVVYYDLRFGNLCNLKCRMCGPADSSSWYEDWVSLKGKDSFKDTSGEIKLNKVGSRYSTQAYDWHYSDQFWNQFEKTMSHINYIYMAGGEPLLIKRHYDFLEKCLERGYAKNIILEYNTNCTQLPEKALKMWSDFKAVRVGASIDGFGDVLEYQRHPANWESVYKNLLTLNNQPKNIMVWLAFTVTAYNVFHMVDFMKWKLKNNDLKNINSTKHRPIISPHVAHNPKYLNIRVLPKELKNQVKEKFDEFGSWLKQEEFPEHVQRQGQKIIDSTVKYMRSEDYHEEYWPDFCRYSESLDQIRGQKLLDVCPEYRGHLRPRNELRI